MKIRIELDKAVCAGEVTVAAVVKRWVFDRGGSSGGAIHGAKQPVAILVRRHDVTTAFEIDGQLIGRDEFERRFPGLVARTI